MKLLAATLASILAVLLLNLAVVLVRILISGQPIYWNQILFMGYWVLVVTTVAVILIGIPVYLLLKRRGKASKINLAIVGFIIPMVVFAVISIFLGRSSVYSAGRNYYGTYRAMIVDGERTFWGWLSVLEQGFVLGIFGAIAAVVFGYTVECLSAKNNEKHS